MKADPSALPIATIIQPDPFPRELGSGIQRRDELLRAAEQSLATFVLEESGVKLPASAPFEHDAICGAQTTISSAAEEVCMHLDFARSGVEAAYKLCTDDGRKAVLLSIVADLGVMLRELRGGE